MLTPLKRLLGWIFGPLYALAIVLAVRFFERRLRFETRRDPRLAIPLTFYDAHCSPSFPSLHPAPCTLHPVPCTLCPLTLPGSPVTVRDGPRCGLRRFRRPPSQRPRRLARPRTPPFHGDNTGSNPVGDAI
jgi:hypothetical protein